MLAPQHAAGRALRRWSLRPTLITFTAPPWWAWTSFPSATAMRKTAVPTVCASTALATFAPTARKAEAWVFACWVTQPNKSSFLFPNFRVHFFSEIARVFFLNSFRKQQLFCQHARKNAGIFMRPWIPVPPERFPFHVVFQVMLV